MAKCIMGKVEDIADEQCQMCVRRMSRETCPNGQGTAECDEAIMKSVANTNCRRMDDDAEGCARDQTCMVNEKWGACVFKPKPYNCKSREAWTHPKKVWCCQE